MANVNVGLIGAGTVGRGVVRLLRRNAGIIRMRSGVLLRLVHVADRGIDAIDARETGPCRRSSAGDAVVEDPEVDVVVELIGGVEPARALVVAALERGKHVVTANKALLARHGRAILALARRQGVEVGFEASVAGTIPILRVLRDGLAADRIESLAGILNGTSNYVLTRMEEAGLELSQAVAEARELGFAEADPSLDVDGTDAAQKLAILAAIAFGRSTDAAFPVTGIRQVTGADVETARARGCVIKLVARATRAGGRLQLSVSPELLPREHPLARVRLEQNAVLVEGEASGATLYCGRGAGSLPTATAVLGDVIELGRRRAAGRRHPRLQAAS